MKQIILGLLGTSIVVYTIVSCLSVYSISSRRNEMENCLASVLAQSMEAYFVRQVPMWAKKEAQELTGEPGENLWKVVYVKERKYSDAQVEAFVKQDLIAQLRSDSKVTVSVRACDMENGILSVGITEKFYLPNGMEKTSRCDKTLVAEQGGMI